jgi:Icc-related predicted phosphoesterase
VRGAKIKIQVTHAPPKGTSVDIITTGAHVGSDAVRKFIDKVHPNAAFCSHIHEGRGVDEIGNTKIINSGRFPEGYCGLAEIDEESVNAKIVSLT